MNRDGAWWMACSICGEDEMDFEYIYSPDSISLSKTSYTYDGKVKSPEVIVKDWMGNTISPEYYTVKTPAGRKNVGKYTYTIEFQERYSGTEELTFIQKLARFFRSIVDAIKNFFIGLIGKLG